MATVQGVYKNYPTIYIVQMFGTPAYGKTVLDTKDTLAPPVKFQAEKIATTTLQVASSTEKAPTGDIKGVYTQASSTASTTPVSVLEKVVSTQDLAIVKNTSVASIPNNVNLPAKSYSTWYEKVLFKCSYYIDFVYKALLLVVAFSLVTMVLVEIRKQHYIHILYGIFLLLLLTLFMYINQTFY
jgi:hypothetical protein